MADVFLDLDDADRREAFQVAAAASGPLEKDVWSVWLLDVLFRAPSDTRSPYYLGTLAGRVDFSSEKLQGGRGCRLRRRAHEGGNDLAALLRRGA